MMKSGQAGFTLIETSIAMAILAMAILLSADLNIRGANSVAYDQRMSQSIQIASALMEELVVTFSTDPRLSAGNHTQYYDSSGRSVATADVFKATWTVTPNSPTNQVMQINLQVQWTGSSTIGASLLTFRGPG